MVSSRGLPTPDDLQHCRSFVVRRGQCFPALLHIAVGAISVQTLTPPGMKTEPTKRAWGLIVLLVVTHSMAATRYVDLNSPIPMSPFTSWATAATNIQMAVNVAQPGDEVLVFDGIYALGGMVESGSTRSNRVNIWKPITVRSVNGPEVTIIKGYQDLVSTNSNSSIRCAFLASGATLTGFTLKNGSVFGFGGGVYCDSLTAVVSNCILIGNASADSGGGGARGTFQNCILRGNTSFNNGGGAYEAVLHGCLVVSNVAVQGGGGCAFSALTNCTVAANVANNGGGYVSSGNYPNFKVYNSVIYSNSAATAPNYYFASIHYSCTTPLPGGGIGNISNSPAFLNPAVGDYRLQATSPCINAGSATSALLRADLDNQPRMVGGSVDLGAYEYQSPQSLLSYAWAARYGLPTDGSRDLFDADGDGASNWQEWRADTVPTNALSALRVVSVTNGPTGSSVTWQSVATRNYWIERSTNLLAATPFRVLATNLVGLAGTMTYTDTNTAGVAPRFYRVGVH